MVSLLEQACQQQNIDLQYVIDELSEVLAIPETENFAAMPLDELVRYIEKVHHTYVQNAIPPLNTYLTKLSVAYTAKDTQNCLK